VWVCFVVSCTLLRSVFFFFLSSITHPGGGRRQDPRPAGGGGGGGGEAHQSEAPNALRTNICCGLVRT